MSKSEIEKSLTELESEWKKCDAKGVPARHRKHLLANINSHKEALKEIESKPKKKSKPKSK